MFKQVNINIPLVDVIKHVPAYAKFFKELCTLKTKPKKVTRRIRLSEDVSAVVLNNLPKKLKDPSAPLVS